MEVLMRDAILEALRQRYESHIAEAHAVIKIYLDNSVGIGEHPQHLEEIDKQLSKIVDYGNSAFVDVALIGIIISPQAGILARIADKLKRLESENLEVSESKGDTIKDLIGYLVILLILDETR